METKSPNTPTTDGEHWSDETEGEASPEHVGYAALDQYQPLGEEGDEDEDEEEEGDEEGTDEQRTEGVAGDGWPAGVVDVDTSRQPDIASVLLRAMEEDYRACVESEGHVVSNGPIVSTTAATETTDPPSEEHAQQLEGNGTPTPDQGQGIHVALGNRGGVEDDDVVEAPAPAPAPAPMRPVSLSPLGQDRAERVIRAMQGFTLAAPPLPPAQFEADWGHWGHPSALANLAAATTTRTTRTTSTEAEEKGGETIEPATAPANESQR